MKLSDFQPEERLVALGKGQLSVVGLSFEHWSILVREHLPDLDGLYELVAKHLNNSLDFSAIELKPVIGMLVSQAPGLMANVIALASAEDSEDRVNAAAAAIRIPAGKQIEIIQAIVELSFSETGGVKKALEIVTGLLLTKSKPKMAAKKGMKTKPR